MGKLRQMLHEKIENEAKPKIEKRVKLFDLEDGTQVVVTKDTDTDADAIVKIKIYTEEQVKSMIDDAHNGVDGYYDILKNHNPIEFPSDEEIQTYVNSTPYYGHCTMEYCEGIEDGIKWVIDKIKGDK